MPIRTLWQRKRPGCWRHPAHPWTTLFLLRARKSNTASSFRVIRASVLWSGMPLWYSDTWRGPRDSLSQYLVQLWAFITVCLADFYCLLFLSLTPTRQCCACVSRWNVRNWSTFVVRICMFGTWKCKQVLHFVIFRPKEILSLQHWLVTFIFGYTNNAAKFNKVKIRFVEKQTVS